jgi:hypothetical protein
MFFNFRRDRFLSRQVLSDVAIDTNDDGSPDALGMANPDGTLIGGGVAAADYDPQTISLVGNQADQILWSPTVGTSIVITDVVISVKGASADVTLEWDKAGGDEAFLGTLYFADRGGMAMPFRGLLPCNEANADLVVTTTNAVGATVTVTVNGYEV